MLNSGAFPASCNSGDDRTWRSGSLRSAGRGDHLRGPDDQHALLVDASTARRRASENDGGCFDVYP